MAPLSQAERINIRYCTETMVTAQNHCAKNCLWLPRAACILILALWTPSGHPQDPNTTADSADSTATEPNLDNTEDSKTTEPAANPVQRYTSDNSETLQTRLFSEQTQDKSLVWLDDKSEKFVGLWQPDTSGQPLGAVLLLHGEGHTPDWPQTVQALRKNLPEFGWATLSIGLPNPELKPVPPREIKAVKASEEKQTNATTASNTKDTNKTKTEEPATSEAEEIYDDSTDSISGGRIKPPAAEQSPATKPTRPAEEIVAARLRQALQFLNEKGQFNIVLLGEGMGAARALAFINQLPKPQKETRANAKAKMIAKRPIRAFIMVNARNRIPHQDTLLTDYLSDTELPILDISFAYHYLDKIEITERKLAAKQKHLKHYNAIKIMAPTSQIFDGENQLTRRIRGFLDKYAKGVKLDGARIEQAP